MKPQTERKIEIKYLQPHPDESDLDWLARFVLKKMRKEGLSPAPAPTPGEEGVNCKHRLP